MPTLTTAAQGFAFAFALIAAIGAQNAYVLQQGLLRRPVLGICLICAGSDALLISVGVFGFGNWIADSPVAVFWMSIIGAAFLFCYAAIRLRAAILNTPPPKASDSHAGQWLTVIALTWLNPHVYLDTVVLLGGASARFDELLRPWFAGGAMLASLVFFLSLGYSARALSAHVRRPGFWRVLDVLVAVLMAGIGGQLLRGVV